MASINEFMARGHHACDEAFARAEEAAGGDWPAAERGFAQFRGMLEHHLAMEEEILFPAFEEATGMSGGGPTEAMRVEHDQMRGLLDEMKAAVAARDTGTYRGVGETLLVLMQQHNLKEESMMYPMIDQAAAAQVPGLIGRCNALEGRAG